MSAKLSLIAADFFERPVKLRLPFRFGVVTLREAPQVFVRAQIKLADGRQGEGVSAELLAPKWFDKSANLTNEDNFDQLRRSLTMARSALLAAGRNTPFGLSAAVDGPHHDACAKVGLNGLVASFGLALLDRAIIDALGRLEGASVFALVKDNRLGLDATTATDLAGFDFGKLLASLKPAQSIHARHTVGLVDALTRAETNGQRIDDGLPESLEEVVATYGHRFFKLKVSGHLDADLERLTRIAGVLDTIRDPFQISLDGNEQYDDVEQTTALWEAMEAEPALQRLCASTLFVEQPIKRQVALARSVQPLARFRPVIIDESDGDLDAFVRARSLGYTGVSSKNCKGFYKSLINLARCRVWNAAGEGGYFMSGEDLTTQAGLSVQQDLALVSLLGLSHVERNGHHFIDGFAGRPAAETEAFLAAHPDLYHRQRGRVRLHIEGGLLHIGSLECAGFGTPVTPDLSATAPMPKAAWPPAAGAGPNGLGQAQS